MPAETDPPAFPALCAVPEAKRVRGKQGPIYEQGVSAERAGARAVHLQRLSIPPGAMERARKHSHHETAICTVPGRSAVWRGDDLRHHAEAGPGSFVYIAADTPHMPYNPDSNEPCLVVIARTDPNEQESVTLPPELEERCKQRHRP